MTAARSSPKERRRSAGLILPLSRSHRIEGKKTMGLELAKQCGWELPDMIFYPTGGGTGLIGMWKAFAELEAIGFVGPKRPRMVAVQASSCAPLVLAFNERPPRLADGKTHRRSAAGIRVPQAIGDFLILHALLESTATRSRSKTMRSKQRCSSGCGRRVAAMPRRRGNL